MGWHRQKLVFIIADNETVGPAVSFCEFLITVIQPVRHDGVSCVRKCTL